MNERNIFREKLYNHTLPVREGLWEGIEANLPPQKERRVFPVFWFLLFASAFLGGAMMLGLFRNDQANSRNATPDPIPSATPSAHAESLSETNTDFSSLNTNNTDESIPGTASNTTSTKTNTTTSTDHATGSHPGNAVNLTRETKAIARSKNKRPEAAKANPSIPSISSSDSYSGTASLLPTDALAGETMMPSRGQHDATSLLPGLDMELMSTTDLFVINARVKPDPNCYKFTTGSSPFAFSVDVFGGPGISPKSFEDKTGESTAYISAREATEKNQYAWSAGTRLNLHHRSGLTARIGFTYTQAGDVFDYTDSLATQSTTRIDSFFAADGTFLYAETSQVLILGTLIKKIHNTYRYLDIPLILGFEMPMGRSNLMFNLGPVFNITSSHEGQILDPMLHPRSITPGEPGYIDVYKTNVGMSLYIGAGILFPISDHFSGLVEPSFLYRLNPVTQNGYPVNEHRHYAGLNLGLRYHIQ